MIFFIQGNNFRECYSSLEEAVFLFLQLGFHVHPEKSVLIPSQSLTFLGFNLNSVSMTVTLTQEKRDQLESLCTEAMNGEDLSIRFVPKVIGKVVSALPGMEFGRLHYRNLERDKIYALSANQGDYDALMQLSPAAKEELRWWCDNVGHGYRRIQHASYSHSFQVDASDSGWGIACTTDESLQSHGFWSQEQRSFHINVRELYVVFICLTVFCKEMSDTHIRFEIDNTTAVSYVNGMGGCKSAACNEVAKKIWDWCIQRGLWLSAVHIPGTMNVKADALSRRHYSDHEWMLNNAMFSRLCKIFPGLTIDLFASILNHRLPRYVSWGPDSQAFSVDAFDISWKGQRFYAFPPFSLIPRCLEKVVCDQAEGVLVVSAWPTQTCYTRIVQMLISQPVHGDGLHERDESASTPIGSADSQHAGSFEVDGLPSIRRYYQMQGFSEHITDVLVKSATQKQYSVYIKKWAIFCGARKIAPFLPDLSNVLEFLYTLLNLSYSSIS